jgi:hypothetical protein
MSSHNTEDNCGESSEPDRLEGAALRLAERLVKLPAAHLRVVVRREIWAIFFP